MADMLHELENNEAILLMYIAGELPDEERREVQQMLASDAGLRATHDELKSAWQGAMAGIEQLDTADATTTMSTEVAARQVGRLVRQWHTAKVVAPRKIEPSVPTGRRLAWWQTAAAAAAVMFLGFLVYWGWTDPPATNVASSTPSTEPTDIASPPNVALQGGPFGQRGGGGRGWGGGPGSGAVFYRLYDPDNASDDGVYSLPYFDPSTDTSVADAKGSDLDRQLDTLRFFSSSDQ